MIKMTEIVTGMTEMIGIHEIMIISNFPQNTFFWAQQIFSSIQFDPTSKLNKKIKLIEN